MRTARLAGAPGPRHQDLDPAAAWLHRGRGSAEPGRVVRARQDDDALRARQDDDALRARQDDDAA